MPKPAGTGVSGLLLVVLGLLAAAGPFAIDMYLPAFTDLAEDLHTSPSNVQLTLTAFLLGMGLGQLVIGPLSDRFGRRLPLVLAAGGAVVVTVLCALAPTIWLLIPMRLLQGFAAAAGVVLSRAVAADRTSGTATAKVFTLFSTIVSIAPVIAPLLGGALAPLGWRAEFWVLSGIFALMFLGALLVVPESLPPENRHPGGSAKTRADIRSLLADRAYLGYVFAFALGFGGLMSYISASPFVIEKVLGMSTGAYTLIFAMNSLGMVLVGLVASRLIERFGPASLLRTAQFVILGFSLVLLTLMLFDAPAAAVLPVLFVAVAASPMFMGTASALAIGRARHIAGTASALMGALQAIMAALVSPLSGLAGEGTGVPMAALMVTCAVLAVGARRLATTAPAPAEAGHPDATEAGHGDTAQAGHGDPAEPVAAGRPAD